MALPGQDRDVLPLSEQRENLPNLTIYLFIHLHSIPDIGPRSQGKGVAIWGGFLGDFPVRHWLMVSNRLLTIPKAAELLNYSKHHEIGHGVSTGQYLLDAALGLSWPINMAV